ncbi:MAG: hypothetical protein Kow0029_01650 [Candidatus Rifleibacteriota bacterium]
MTENKIEPDDNEEIRIVEEFVEGFWNCPNCATKCRGSEQNCSNCGAIRGENVEFHCEDDAPAITDEEELAKAKAGPDWICRFCGNTSPAGARKCTGCGSDREDGKKRAVNEEPVEDNEAKSPATPIKTAKPMPLGCQVGCGVIALIFLVLMALSCQQKPGKLEITGNFWKRTVEREQLTTVREKAWKNEVPANARKISSSREIRNYKLIPDGYEMVDETYTQKVKVGEKKVKAGKVNLGNGRFKIKYKMVPEYREEKKTRRVKKEKFKKEPIFDEKVTYEIDRWKPIDRVEASGTEDEPKWPETNATDRSPPQVGDIRAGKRTEEYWVKAKRLSDGKEFEIRQLKSHPLTYDQFMKLRKGTQWDAVFSGLGALTEIKFDKTAK